MVRREPSARDRRVVAVRLTPGGASVFAKLAKVHRAELRRVAPEFVRIMSGLAKPDPG